MSGMKKWIGALLAALALTFAFCPAAFAEETRTYFVPEADLYVSVPADWVVFTRDIRLGDPNLSGRGLTAAEVRSYMEENDRYFMAWDKAVNTECYLAMQESDSADFAAYSDEELMLGTEETYREIYAAADTTLLDCSLYTHPQEKLIVTEAVYAGEEQVAFCSYETVHGGKYLSFTLLSHTGQLSDEQRLLAQSMVDSFVFDVSGGVTEDTPSFTYTDALTGTTFTVPANWVMQDDYEDESGTVVFRHNRELSAAIAYNATDLWSSLSPLERMGSSRAETDNRVSWDKEEMLNTLGIQEGVGEDVEFKEVSYGGKTFYKITYEMTQEGVTVPVTTLFTINNGYVYVFATGAVSEQRLNDLGAMVGSVTFGTLVPESDSELDTPQAALGMLKGILGQIDWKQVLLQTLLNWGITLAVCALPVLVYRYAIRRRVLERKKAVRAALIYAAAVFVVLTAVFLVWNGSIAPIPVVVAWGFVNYRVLAGSRKAAAPEVTALPEETAPPEESAAEEERGG